MQRYVWAVMGLGAVVDLLLLQGADRLCGSRAGLLRSALAAIAGGLYSGLCLAPGFHFLGNFLWRGVSLAGMALIAWGLHRRTLRRGAVFAVLSLAFGGLAQGLGDGGLVSWLAAAAGMGILYLLGFRGRGCLGACVPVEIRSGDTHLELSALRDTGNALLDPVTGQSVLVLGADAAHRLTGLSREQLRSPVESLGAIPGLRLVPYRTVNGSGLMLARKYQDVKIGKWKGSQLVAFAPEGLGGGYEALTGGAV